MATSAELFAVELQRRFVDLRPEMVWLEATIRELPPLNAIVNLKFRDGGGASREEGWQLGPLAEVVGSTDPGALAQWAMDRIEIEQQADDDLF